MSNKKGTLFLGPNTKFSSKDYGPENPLSELMELSETRVQVEGPPMHLTLILFMQ